MSNLENGVGGEYAPKMDNGMSKAITDWWNGLSKLELLTYILEQDTITADDIREMLAHEQCVLHFGLEFAVSESTAVTEFQKAGK